MNFIKIKYPDGDFEMADAPVTQSEWQEVMGNNPSYFKDKPNNPVESVSWDDCQEFIKKLNASQKEYSYSLPTENQWEFCAKFCDEQKIDEIAWHYENSGETTHTVKSLKANDLGLHDMLGNVCEWCEDKMGSYRVFRGGGWDNYPVNLRSARRGGGDQSVSYYAVGFRLLRTPLSEKEKGIRDEKNLANINKFTVLHFAPTFSLNLEKLTAEDKKWIEQMLSEWTEKMKKFTAQTATYPIREKE